MARWDLLQLKARIERPKQQVSFTVLSHNASHTDFMMTSASGASSSILSSGTGMREEVKYLLRLNNGVNPLSHVGISPALMAVPILIHTTLLPEVLQL